MSSQRKRLFGFSDSGSEAPTAMKIFHQFNRLTTFGLTHYTILCQASKHMNQKFFEGKPCKTCKSALRYLINRACVRCTRRKVALAKAPSRGGVPTPSLGSCPAPTDLPTMELASGCFLTLPADYEDF